MVKVCTDIPTIQGILTHPKVRDWLTDDNSSFNYEPVIHPQIIYLVNKEHTGVIRIDPLNSMTCSVHIATTPELWGKGAEFALEALTWGFKNTQYSKVVAIIPEYNERTIKLVQKIGFVKEGVITKSFLKRWKVHNQFLFGLYKGDT